MADEPARQTSLPLPDLEPPPVVREATLNFDRAMWNRWQRTLLEGKLAGTLHQARPGDVIRPTDGTLYGVGWDGSLHVARDQEGRKLRPPRPRQRPKPAAGALEPESGREGDSRVVAPLEIGRPGATSR